MFCKSAPLTIARIGARSTTSSHSGGTAFSVGFVGCAPVLGAAETTTNTSVTAARTRTRLIDPLPLRRRLERRRSPYPPSHRALRLQEHLARPRRYRRRCSDPRRRRCSRPGLGRARRPDTARSTSGPEPRVRAHRRRRSLRRDSSGERASGSCSGIPSNRPTCRPARRTFASCICRSRAGDRTRLCAPRAPHHTRRSRTSHTPELRPPRTLRGQPASRARRRSSSSIEPALWSLAPPRLLLLHPIGAAPSSMDLPTDRSR